MLAACRVDNGASPDQTGGMSALPRNRVLVSAVPVAALVALLAPFARAGQDYRYPRSDFGQRIAGVSGEVEVWWCEATWKVARERPTPQNTAPAATMSAARNDFEAVQVVVRPKKGLRQLTAAIDGLSGPHGASISAGHIQVLRVYYHFVGRPTDRTGVRDWWPDALPPLDKPLDLAAGWNQPLWVLVHVPEDAKAGDYTGTLRLKADGWSAAVPVTLHVWNFALPARNHLETGFGLGLPQEYLHLKTEADKRRAWDLYFQAFADHRISPYDPTPMDPIRRKFLFHANPPRTEFDFSAFDRAMRRAIEKFHFTNLRLDVDGVGGELRDPQGHVADVGGACRQELVPQPPELLGQVAPGVEDRGHRVHVAFVDRLLGQRRQCRIHRHLRLRLEDRALVRVAVLGHPAAELLELSRGALRRLGEPRPLPVRLPRVDRPALRLACALDTDPRPASHPCRRRRSPQRTHERIVRQAGTGPPCARYLAPRDDPKRRSVPARSRAMLSWWKSQISTGPPAANT